MLKIKYLMLVIWLKKQIDDTKVTEIENKLNNHNHDKYISTREFNTLAADVFNARLSRANLDVKTIFDNTVSSLDTKINGNKSLGALLQRTFKTLESPDLCYVKSKSHFGEDGAQNHLVFQPINKYFKVITTDNNYVSSWKGLSTESIKPPTTSNDSFTPV